MVGIRAVRELLRAEPRLRFLRMFLANKEPAREVTGLLAADVLVLDIGGNLDSAGS